MLFWFPCVMWKTVPFHLIWYSECVEHFKLRFVLYRKILLVDLLFPVSYWERGSSWPLVKFDLLFDRLFLSFYCLTIFLVPFHRLSWDNFFQWNLNICPSFSTDFKQLRLAIILKTEPYILKEEEHKILDYSLRREKGKHSVARNEGIFSFEMMIYD